MAGSGSSPHADEPNCGGRGASPQDSEDFHGYSTAASPLSTSPSGQAPRTSVVANEGAASPSACAPDDDDEPTERDKDAAVASFLLGPRSSSPTAMGESSPTLSSCSGFSGGASTSSSPDAYEQILESSFWMDEDKACDDMRAYFGRDGYEACDDMRAYFGRDEYEACDDMRAYFGRDEYEASQNFSSTIHQKAPLSSLPAKLVSENMKAQINMLLASYSVYREICPDGNCFYRSFISSYLEQLEASPNEELRLFGVLEPMGDKFQSLHGFDSYSDLYIAFVCFILECVEQKREQSVSAYQDWLFQESQNEQKFANILSYLRLITAIEICTKAEKYEPFIDNSDQKLNVVEYCREVVIPMKQEAEHVNLFALTGVLQVPLQVVYIWDKPTEPNTHIIYESPDSSVPTLTLLYRPGHYDIIYEK